MTIDPGNHTGWARFDSALLVACGLTTPAQWLELVLVMTADRPAILIEEPTLYPHSKARPADVMALQLKVGELKGRFEMAGCKVELVQPRVWKHQIPKHVHNARTLKHLSNSERALAEGQRHDVLDAVGLGLWKLGRLK